MMQILERTPVWVWPLLIGLIFLGLRSTKDRTAPLWLYYAVPFLGLLGLRTVFSLPQGVIVWIGFAVAFMVGESIGYRLQIKWIIEKLAKTIRVRGEWFTFAMIMILFLSNFVLGVTRGVSPQTVSQPIFLVIFVAVIGFASGSFTGRSLRIIHVKNTTMV